LTISGIINTFSERIDLMTPASSAKLTRRGGGGEQARFRTIARRVSESIGAEFFSMLVNELRQALDAECVYIGEFAGGKTERVETMAACAKEGRINLPAFPLVGSPDAEVALGKPGTFGRGVKELFPEFHLLRDLDVQAYVGIALHDPDGQACGVIAALFREPQDREIYFAQSMLNVFVARASAELNRKRGEDALRESEQRYHAFVEMNPDGCWRTEFDEPIATTLPEEEQLERILRDGRVAECNNALALGLGRERDQLIGVPLAEVVLDLENARHWLLDLIHAGYSRRAHEVTAVDRSGKRGNYLVSNWGIVENGRLLRVWGSIRDVTELKELEDQLRQAQKMESMGRLAGGVAHDFNNLLTIINGYSEILMGKLSQGDPLREYAVLVNKAGERAGSLTKQLLTFSRQQVIQPKPMDLNSAVRETESMLRSLIGEDISLLIRLGPQVCWVLADPDQIHQVLMNLVANARDAMPHGGRLIIETTEAVIDEKYRRSHPDATAGRFALMTVVDTGCGIDEATRQKIFEPFFTTKEPGKGTGLGLATVYGIIHQLKGWIDVESEPGLGATFRIYLPCGEESPETGENALARKSVQPGSETILLVEDQQDVRGFARTALESNGYRVIEAASGIEAIGLSGRYPGVIHMMITDVVMPGMDGRALADQLKVQRPEMKVLFMSGYTADVIVQRGIADNVVGILQKPFSHVALAGKVREVLTAPERSS
jgi:PAS domain S-box-containing protein